MDQSLGSAADQISALFDRYKVLLVALATVGVLVVAAQILLDGWNTQLSIQLVLAILLLSALVFHGHLSSPALVSVAYLFVLSFVFAGATNIGFAEPSLFVLVALVVTSTVIWGLNAGLITLVVALLALVGLASRFLVFAPTSFDLTYFLVSPTRWVIFLVSISVSAIWCILIVDLQRRYWLVAVTDLQSEGFQRQENEARLNQAVTLAGLGYFVIDVIADRCEICSDDHAAFHEQTPQEFIDEMPSLASGPPMIHLGDRERVLLKVNSLMQGQAISIEYRVIPKSGATRYLRVAMEPVVDENGAISKAIGTSLDLTERRRTEEDLRQSQKMEAIGNLTGGMAHDFNNLLAVIVGNLELLREEATCERQRELIDAGLGATERAANLTKSMLSFARRAELQTEVVELNGLIREAKNWIGRTLPANINVETSLLAGLWDVEVDPGATENALLNLILNARDAMPDGGKLTLETANIRIDDEYTADWDEDVEPGRYVMLAVSDTGHGIPNDMMQNIYDPFFSTKAPGLGSGMGLSMVQGFVKQSGGAIRVYSESDVGTTVRLYFKAVPGRVEEPAVLTVATPSATKAGKRILVVEDDAGVLAVLVSSLEKVGYAVTSASTGDQGIQLFQSEPTFDALLTDIVMPGALQGTDLARAAREINPDLPVVFMSGYAREATVHGNGLHPDDIRLMKPVRKSDLIRALETALGPSDV